MIDQILSDIVKKQVGSDVAILMGGGVDSATLLITCLRQSKKVHGYSFFMEDEITYDSLKAEEICKIFKIESMPSFCLVKDKQCINTFKGADINGIKKMLNIKD